MRIYPNINDQTNCVLLHREHTHKNTLQSKIKNKTQLTYFQLFEIIYTLKLHVLIK